MSVSILKTHFQDNLWILREKRYSLYASLLAHPAEAYPGFLTMKQLGALLIPPWMGSYSITRLPNSISSNFPDNLVASIYTPGWREALWE